MATASTNLSEFNSNFNSNCADFKIGIVVSAWNDSITGNLCEGAISTLKAKGIQEDNLIVKTVPGAFELALGAQFLFENTNVEGVIAIGVVIQGETRHFDFVCSGATQGIMDVSLKYNKPVSFCLLTDNTIQQSIDRSGGKYGNKGVECAIACLQMIALKRSL